MLLPEELFSIAGDKQYSCDLFKLYVQDIRYTSVKELTGCFCRFFFVLFFINSRSVKLLSDQTEQKNISSSYSNCGGVL